MGRKRGANSRMTESTPRILMKGGEEEITQECVMCTWKGAKENTMFGNFTNDLLFWAETFSLRFVKFSLCDSHVLFWPFSTYSPFPISCSSSFLFLSRLFNLILLLSWCLYKTFNSEWRPSPNAISHLVVIFVVFLLFYAFFLPLFFVCRFLDFFHSTGTNIMFCAS